MPADEVLTSDSSRFWPADDWSQATHSTRWTSGSSVTGHPPSPTGTALPLGPPSLPT
ncbi:phosphoribosylaminoimidazolesuccinocarboxamide synthase [Thermomonospora cellulosilytica]|uniref:phosphoribosylaminoimidazolesuccinocarboxamide synthase n=1 Tax=Thermomonospora cellulosilytica TaxID=1411118 RepID=UPI001FE262C0|nr:phosphoribosylaminoimidazolesuccinocarboxamide synthase [Thermomonospora cellulosilytica]